MSLLEKEDRIFVAGSTGMVRIAICRLLKKNGYSEAKKNLLTSSRVDLDCSNKRHVEKWFKNKKPVVIIATAKVGGIMANMSQPVNFPIRKLKDAE